jgi:integrase
LLTGCRVGEARSARWHHFDLDAEQPTWVKPRGMTKQKRPHRLPLSSEAVAILRDLKAAQLFSPYGALGDTSLRRAWSEITKAAAIADLRVHDLRHWHASLLASMGLSLQMIGSLLGHAHTATTQRYAHLLDTPLRKASGELGQLIELAGRRR